MICLICLCKAPRRRRSRSRELKKYAGKMGRIQYENRTYEHWNMECTGRYYNVLPEYVLVI